MRVIGEYRPAARSTSQLLLPRRHSLTSGADATPLVLCRSARRWNSVLFISPAGKDSEEFVRLERLAPKIERAANPFARGDTNHQPVDHDKVLSVAPTIVASGAPKNGDRTNNSRDESKAGQLNQQHRGRRHERLNREQRGMSHKGGIRCGRPCRLGLLLW